MKKTLSNNIKTSIVVMTYNSDIRKTLFTLDTIIKQRCSDYEIIVSDDGSEDNKFEQIESFFNDNEFKKYKLLAHEKNSGTVQNLINAISVAEGEYIRDFGSGDGFYSKNTLQYINHYLEEKKPDILFGLMRGFHKNDDEIMTSNFCHPFDIQAYRKKNTKTRIMKNMVLYGDNLSGASIVVKKDLFMEYLNEIKEYVAYEEDLITTLAAVRENNIQLLDRYMIWYEDNTGSSTNKNSKFKEKLQLDVDRFFTYLYETYPDNKYVKKRHKLNFLFGINNLYLRTIVRFVFNPGAIIYLFLAFVERLFKLHRPKKTEMGFLDESINDNNMV